MYLQSSIEFGLLLIKNASITKRLQEHFTVFLAPDSAASHGSRAERIRLWMVIIDVPRPLADERHAESKFFALLDSMRMEEKYSFEKFRMDEDILRAQVLGRGYDRQQKRKDRDSETWKRVHMELFAILGLDWPAAGDSGDHASQFRQREYEITIMANHMFPVVDQGDVNKWTFFDTLHTAERTFRVAPDFLTKANFEHLNSGVSIDIKKAQAHELPACLSTCQMAHRNDYKIYKS